MKNISQKDAHDLLEQTAELIVCLRSWGIHQSDWLRAKNADTGKVINPKQNPLSDIENIILKIRHNLRINPNRVRNLMRNKTYCPDWKNPSNKWKIIDRKRFESVIVLLCKNNNRDYAVFTDLLSDRSYPCDKFFGTFKGAYSCYKATIKREAEGFIRV